MAEPITLTVHCARCGGAVGLQFADWTGDACRQKIGHWTCPYCQRENSGAFPGRIVWAAKGSDEHGETPH